MRATPETRDRRLDLKKILVPLDFSGRSREALRYALGFARQRGAKVSLIHVVESVIEAQPNRLPGGAVISAVPPVDPEELIETARVHLRELAAQLVPAELLGEQVVTLGRTYDQITAHAEELRTDLIVIATHGYSGVTRLLLGSTAERVVQYAPCSVLVVRRPDAQLAEGKHHVPNENPLDDSPARILVPLDFSARSFKALDTAAGLACEYGSEMVLVSVVEADPFVAGIEGVVIAVPEKSLIARSQQRLRKIAHALSSSIPVTTEVEHGKPFEVITRIAREKDVDLIVLTTHGWTGIHHLLIGSTAERVVRNAHCPVLVVRNKSR